MINKIWFVALLGLTACEHGDPGSLHLVASVADSSGRLHPIMEDFEPGDYQKDTVYLSKTFRGGPWKITVTRMSESEMKAPALAPAQHPELRVVHDASN